MEAGLVSALVGSGPLGIIILYMMYLQKTDRDTRKEERQRRDEIDKEERQRRDEIDKDRLATDKSLVATLTTLAAKIDELGK